MSSRAYFISLFFIATAIAQQLPPAPKAHLIDLAPRAKTRYSNEPSIAVNPGNPLEVAVAWQTNASVAFSRDAGQTWTVAQDTAPKEYRVSGDVSITYDAQGRAVLCYIAFDKLGTEQYWAQGATRNGIFVRRAEDGGQTWRAGAVAVISHESAPQIPFEDKPYLVAATSGPHAGDLYVGWTQFTLSTTELLFSRSSDGGATWSRPIKLSSVPGLPRDDNGALEGFDGFVAPDGTLYTVWDDRDGIMMAESSDGGLSFSPERRILRAGPAYFDITGVRRTSGFPQIGLDPHSGRIYVAWSDYINGDVDVFASWSSDHGKTWSAPVRVNNDPIHDGKDQFFQWLAVDPVSGAVNVVFYDRRTDKITVTLARSTDGGKSFTNYAWDQEGFEAQGDFLGDYLALAAYGNKVFGAWTHKNSKSGKKAEKDASFGLRVGVADFH
jgi:hypothetical protein